tara:strand:+ start:1331 stop:2281 length:951 start_codon:yes stop_codon:yes gene_type:complete
LSSFTIVGTLKRPFRRRATISEPDTQIEHTATILFADLCGSTPSEETGNWTAFEVIGSALDRHTDIIRDCGGVVIRSKGDDLLCTFEEADDAMQAATKMLLAQLEATVQIRIGLHHGSFISGRGDIFGDAVNTAARLMGLAQPDERIASAALAEQLSDELSEHLLPFDQQHLKGKADATVVYRLLPPDDDVTEMIPVKTQIRRQAQTATIQIRLEYAGQRVVLDESRPNITIGRADDAELHISSRRVSRAHAMTAVRDGRATFTDRSTLGTWIVSQQNELMVRRESVHLVGEGHNCLGAHPSEKAPTTIRYSVNTK